ncbi:MAG: polyprenyl synthetase family protein, partial [Anaerolineae bacterium]
EVPSPHLARFYGMMAYHLGWRDAELRPANQRAGKWIRPAICLLACEAAGGDWTRAVPAAAALELTHNFTLIHDDIQDGDIERRGRPTVWTLWGVPQAINAGDGLFVLARTALHGLHRHNFDPATIERVYRIYDEACRRLVQGQYLDIDFEQRLDVSVDEYLAMISGKTAALLAASLEIGARLATDDATVVDAYRQLGEELGLAFQIVDDILGAWGDEALTGKSAGNDLRRKKKTLPVVYALEREAAADEQPFRTLYQQDTLSDADVETTLRLLEEAGARRYAEDLAQQHWQRAVDTLAEIGIDNPAQRRLRDLARFLVEREF